MQVIDDRADLLGVLIAEPWGIRRSIGCHWPPASPHWAVRLIDLVAIDVFIVRVDFASWPVLHGKQLPHALGLHGVVENIAVVLVGEDVCAVLDAVRIRVPFHVADELAVVVASICAFVVGVPP